MMARTCSGLLCVLACAAGAQAHFAFLLPAAQPGSPYRIILSDDATPDPEVQLNPVRAGHFFVMDTRGKATPVEPGTGGDGYLTLSSSSQAVAAYGTIDYGVVLRGQLDPALIVYHPLALPNLPSAMQSRPAWLDEIALAIVPREVPGGLAFQVIAQGKPVANAEVVVEVTGEKRPRAAKTDAQGMTPAFTAPGTYAARTARIEDRPGEFKGRSYKQVRRYATVVTRYKDSGQP